MAPQNPNIGDSNIQSRAATIPPPSAWSAAWPLLVAVLVSTGQDLFFFTGYYASDDTSYFEAARAVATHGQLDDVNLGSIRLTLLGWNALIIALFGPHVQIVAASYIVLHQVLNLLTFLLGRMLWDSRVGLIGAWLLGTLPMAVIYSSQILPDIPMAIFSIGAMIAFVLACRRTADGAVRCAAAWMGCCGVCVGLGYAAKETGLILLPYFLVAWLTCEFALAKKRDARPPSAATRGMAFVAGIGLVFCAEWLVLRSLAGVDVLRLAWTVQDASGAMESMRLKHGVDPWERLRIVREQLREPFVPLNLGILIGVSLVALPFLRTCRWLVYALPLWMLAYLTWGSTSLSRYSPPSIQARYYLPLYPFFVLLAGAFLRSVHSAVADRLRSPRFRRRWSAFGVVFVAIQPLAWPLFTNSIAGQQYRAPCISAITRAVQLAWASSESFVILSGTAASLAAPLLYSDDDPHSISSEALSPNQLHDLLRGDSAVYIEVMNRSYERHGRNLRCTQLDRALQPLIADLFPFAFIRDDANRSDVSHASEPGVRQTFQLDGFGFIAERIGTIDPPRSRFAVVADFFGLTFPAPRTGRGTDSVLLMRLRALPMEATSQPE